MISTSNLILIFNLKDRVLQEVKFHLILFWLRVFNAVIMVIIGTSLSYSHLCRGILGIVCPLCYHNIENASPPAKKKMEFYFSDKNGWRIFRPYKHEKLCRQFEVVFLSWCMILTYVRNNIISHISKSKAF